MPKLKKRWNVLSQRKRRAKSEPVSHNDHSYCKTTDIIDEFLQEETETYLYTAEPIFEVTENQYEVTENQYEVTEDQYEVTEDQYEDIEYSIAPVDHDYIEPKPLCDYDLIKLELIPRLSAPYVLNTNNNTIQIMEMYTSAENSAVKLTVTVTRDFLAKIYIHRILLHDDHDFWIGLPHVYNTTDAIITLLTKLQSYTVCLGNHEHHLTEFIPVGSYVQSAGGSPDCQGYHEGDHGAVKGTISYSSTIRSVNCKLIVQGSRCSPCTQLRRVLISRKHRRDAKEKRNNENTPEPDFLHRKQSHTSMSRQELMVKVHQQKQHIGTLQTEINKLKKKLHTFQ